MNKYSPFKATLVAAAALSLACAASAQTMPASNTGSSMYGMGQGYVGLSAGQSDYSLGSGTGLFGNDRLSTAYNLSAGAYFNNNVGFEVGYTDFGRVNRGGGSTRADGFNFSLIGKFPASPSFNLLGKIGTTYGRTDVSSLAGSGIAAGSDSGFGLSLGIGAEYMFSSQWAAVVQYDVHQMHFAGGGSERDRLAVASIGLRYKF